jgi:hypothetical protein
MMVANQYNFILNKAICVVIVQEVCQHKREQVYVLANSELCAQALQAATQAVY